MAAGRAGAIVGASPLPSPMRRAHTLLELLLAVAIAGLLLGLAVPSARRLLDGIHARAAASDVVTLLAVARHTATYRGTRTAVHLDSSDATLLVHVGRDTIAVRRLRNIHGVTLHATRDSLAYSATGRGHGGANATIVLARGQAAETVWVSRLGRARRTR